MNELNTQELRDGAPGNNQVLIWCIVGGLLCLFVLLPISGIVRGLSKQLAFPKRAAREFTPIAVRLYQEYDMSGKWPAKLENVFGREELPAHYKYEYRNDGDVVDITVQGPQVRIYHHFRSSIPDREMKWLVKVNEGGKHYIPFECT